MEEEGTLHGGGKKQRQSMRKKTRERSELYDKSCHSSGKRFCVCQLSLERQAVRLAGRLLPFIGREINRGPPGARRATISV